MSSQHRRISPSAASEWQKIFRDATITVVASFILIFEVVVRAEPNAYALGAALAMLGVPATLRLDQARRSKRPNGGDSTTKQATDDDDPNEGPGGYYRAR